MSTEFNNTQFKKIIGQDDLSFPSNLAMGAAWVMAQFKGVNLKVIQVESKTPLADYYILGSATNPIQAESMAREILFQFKKNNIETISVEGLEEKHWILLDFGDIIVHIFQDMSRELYGLDSLWGEAPELAIPNEYYYQNTLEEKPEVGEDNSEQYF